MASLARASSGSAIGRVFEHRYLSYKRTFRASIFSSFLSPVMFLAAMGLGLIPSFAQGFERPDLAPLGSARRRVAILGGGIAGLTAAYELSRKGYECTILEASHRSGGRNLTLRHGDLIDEAGAPQICPFDDEPHLFLNAGPARIPSNHRTLLDYCRELGVAPADPAEREESEGEDEDPGGDSSAGAELGEAEARKRRKNEPGGDDREHQMIADLQSNEVHQPGVDHRQREKQEAEHGGDG